MNSKIKTFLILSGLFLIVALFWVLIGNFLFDVKPVELQPEVNEVRFENINFALTVNDVNESVKYYETLLGFRVIEDSRDSTLSNSIMIKKDDVVIRIKAISDLGDELKEIIKEQTPGRVILNIKVKNIEEYYQSISEGSRVISELKTNSYGYNEFTIMDIDGYVLTFIEEKEN